MDDQLKDHVFKWLVDMPASCHICPLCDSSEHCQCYIDIERGSWAAINTKVAEFYAARSSRRSSKHPLPSIDKCFYEPNYITKEQCPEDESLRYDTALVRGCFVKEVKWDVDGSDLLLKSQNALFPVHRGILSRYSQVFRTLLNDSNNSVIEIDVKARDLKIVLEYLYSYAVVLDAANVTDVLAISRSLDLHSLEDACTKFLEKSLQSNIQKSKKRWSIRDILKKL